MFNEKLNHVLTAHGFVKAREGYLLYVKGKKRVRASIISDEKERKIIMIAYNSFGKPRIFRLPDDENIITRDLLNAFF